MISKYVNVFGIQLIFSSLLLLVQCLFTLGLPNGMGDNLLNVVHLRLKTGGVFKTIDGAAVAEHWIMTTATRVQKYKNLPLEVGIGKGRYDAYDSDTKIINKHCHYHYNPYNVEKYNIALLQTDKPIFENQLAKLPHRGYHVVHNSYVNLYGFGDFSGENLPPDKYLIPVKMETKKRKSFKIFTKTNLILEGDICLGDFGSPVYYFNKKYRYWQLVAITIGFFGKTCFEANYLSATEVTHPEIVEFVDNITNSAVPYGP